jgi:hypothetical protein
VRRSETMNGLLFCAVVVNIWPRSATPFIQIDVSSGQNNMISLSSPMMFVIDFIGSWGYDNYKLAAHRLN